MSAIETSSLNARALDSTRTCDTKQRMNRSVFLFLTFAAIVAQGANLGEPLVFKGTCDASAASALSVDLFVVANDEDNLLRFYRMSRPGKPVQTFDLAPVLSLKGKSEMDLEAAARLGENVFFISSHGRNAEGKPAPGRHRFFALQFTENAGEPSVQVVGRPYLNLASDLAADPRYARFHLADGGFNIEALTDTPDGALLIGFRSPVPEGRALLSPLLNPNEVVAGQPPKFGDPVLIDLRGMGLRGISSTDKDYYMLAGADEGNAPSHLYFSAGGPSAPQLIKEVTFRKTNPEGICVLSVGEKTDFLILSDDGSRKIKGKECKSLPESQREFRAYRFTP